ncbi:helix-turn-helix transcriptional regulator [Blastococcus deserti]|uniref:LuxR C-terminal-related transcriptional regulator n=1 Tax=Blastococcus deserti TaxID=2259033 RepID=A0ABW4XCW0_9ACTN
MRRDPLHRTRDEIADLAQQGCDWVAFAERVGVILERVLPFERSCWHTVDPGTVLITGNLSQGVHCSGSWLAKYEYVVEDVNKWSFLARSGRRAGAMSLATHGDPSRSPRHRSEESYGIGDELRASFVTDGVYWGAAGFLRDRGRAWFTEEDVRFMAAVCEPIADGFRRALLRPLVISDTVVEEGPGVVVFDAGGDVESVSPSAERWIEQMVEHPAPCRPAESKMVQVVAAHARQLAAGHDPLDGAPRARVRTRSGAWLLLYGTPLRGGHDGRTAVIIQPATPQDVAPLVALAYGLSERECQVTQLCLQGLSTRQIAHSLRVSPYTVQDHLKSIFGKTGVRSRGEMVGQVFLEHYVPRWRTAASSSAPTPAV